MTFTDIVILLIVISIVALIIYSMTKKKDEGVCSRCAYAKTCDDDCFPKKREKIQKK
ncbi:MAG: hypothetical protein CVV57_00745 [Tenericutes bacterium HGW-Tenericutes-2]|jgi:hypothetical protein|nr:MAG: hypothetical protein CVV57_00745 [Tenericutes bacterium HGW-Tenericutes-2]